MRVSHTKKLNTAQQPKHLGMVRSSVVTSKKWMGDVFIWAFQPKCNYNARCSIEIDTEKTVNDFTTPRPIATQSGRLRRCGAGRFTPLFFFHVHGFSRWGLRGGQRIQETRMSEPPGLDQIASRETTYDRVCHPLSVRMYDMMSPFPMIY